MRLSKWALVCLLLIGCVSVASAHYLWVAIDIHKGDGPSIDITFEEGPRLGDGSYLDPFVKDCKTWIRTPANPKPTSVETEEMKLNKKRWLTAPLTVKGECAIDARGTFGVYRYGKTDTLLHYNAKHIRVDSAKSLAALARAEKLGVDVVPSYDGEILKATVLFQGKPAARCTVRVRGGGISRNLQTRDDGTISFTPVKKGMYTLHAKIILKGDDATGSHEGKKYVQIHHHGTLSMQLPLADAKPE